MGKLANKINKRIMAALLSLAMIMSNMTVYASSVSDPEPQTGVVAKENEAVAELSLTEDEADVAEESEATQEETTLPKAADGNTNEEGGDKVGSDKPVMLASDDEVQPYADVVIANDFTIDFSYDALNTHSGSTDTVASSIDGLTITDFNWHNDKHGIEGGSNPTLVFNLKQKADIIITGCTYGKDVPSTDSGNLTTEENVSIGDSEKKTDESGAVRHTIKGAEAGTVTVTYPRTQAVYIHQLELKYVDENAPEEYSITITDDDNGTASASAKFATTGTEVTLTATPDNRFKLKEWNVLAGDVVVNDNKFTMGTANVEIQAIFEPKIRRDWDFANDAELKGEKGVQVTTGTQTVAGLTIDASADDSEWNSTDDGTDGASAKNGTKIIVPVEGLCEVKVEAENANYTVDDVAATAAEDTFECEGEGEEPTVVIAMTADNHIKSINVTPIYFVAEGTHDFTPVSAKLKNVFDGITFNDFQDIDNDHGFQSTKDDATIVLNLSDKANVTVMSCQYNNDKSDDNTMTASSGEVVKTKVGNDPQFTVSNADKGLLTLTFNKSGTYIHYIKVDYIDDNQGSGSTPGGDGTYIAGGPINFGTKYTSEGHSQDDPVTGIDGLSTDSNIKYYNAHGLYTAAANATMTLNLQEGRKANITVMACQYGAATGATMTATANGSNINVDKTIVTNGNETGVPQFDIIRASGTVVLTFQVGSTYIHSLNVEYIGGIPGTVDTATFTFDSAKEGIVDGATIDLGSKFVNDYFEIVGTKDAAGKSGSTLELSDKLQTAIQFTTRGKGSVTIDARSTSGSNKSSLVLYKVDGSTNTIVEYDGQLGRDTHNNNILVINGNTANIAKYENLEAGTYKVAVPSEEHDYGRGVRIASVVVAEEVTHEEVTVTVNAPVGAENDNLELVFTCQETGVEMIEEVKGSTCVVTLDANYTYNVSALPTKYVVKEGALLKMGAPSSEFKKTHTVELEAVALRKLTGKIEGLDGDTKALEKLSIIFEKPEGKIYIPETTINKGEETTYEVELEPTVTYTIKTEGINDYELVGDSTVTIETGDEAENKDITYQKKPTYTVTIEPEGATLENLKDAQFTFTNLNEEGYVYDFTGPYDIKLRNGTYSVKVSNSGVFVQQLTPNVVVNGGPVTRTIKFKSDITEWIFSIAEGFTKDICNTSDEDGNYKDGEGNYKGLKLINVVHEGEGKNHAVLNPADESKGKGASQIEIPVKNSCDVVVHYYYTAGAKIGVGDDQKEIKLVYADGESLSTGKTGSTTYSYKGGEGTVVISDVTETTYITKIELRTSVAYHSEITVKPDEDESDTNFKTINDALEAVRNMERTAAESVTIKIEPGDYEEMLVIDVSNVKFVNASPNPSIELKNKGVDIDDNAVRITSYYGHGYSYYSMGNDCKWNAEVLEVNKENKSESYTNPGSGTTNGSYWNATVVITGSNVSAEGIIFENSFNQYISKKASEDVIVKQSGAKEGATARADMEYGDTTVQQKAYVERAAALAIANNCEKISFDNCKFIGHQDTLYGGTPVTAAFYNCSIYGGTDYIFGGMTAVFAKCDLVFNTDGATSTDVGYITAAQQSSGRGYLMYNCHVTSTTPEVDTAATKTSQPGYFGRPWAANTGEAVFYMTVVDAADSSWTSSTSLIVPVGWGDGLSGKSKYSQEYGTYELPDGKDNSAQRADWSNVLTEEKLIDETPITVESFLGTWNPFEDKNMTIDDWGKDIPAPTAPKLKEVVPEPDENGEIGLGAKISLASDTYAAKIYYNVNSDEAPSANSTLYTGPIEVTSDLVSKDNKISIKAVAVRFGKNSAVSESIEYKIKVSGHGPGSGDGLEITFVDDYEIDEESGRAQIPYTGSAIKPEIKVTNNGKPLTLGIDYTVKYSNNTKVSTSLAENKKPKITVTGKGSFSGSKYTYFDITPLDINDDDVVKGRMVVVVNKKVSTPSIYYGSTKLAANKDFIYDKTKTFSETGETTLPIEGSGNFEGISSVPVLVVASTADQKKYSLKFTVNVDSKSAKNLIYTGESLKDDIKGCITVSPKTAGEEEWGEGKTYNIVLPDEQYLTNAGNLKFTVVGLGEYSGCNVTKSVKILPKTISASDVVFEGAEDTENKVVVSGVEAERPFLSTGATLNLSMTYNDDDMVEGRDYKVTYSNNKKAGGNAKYTIAFTGNYKGKYVSSTTFTIGKAELSNDTATVYLADKTAAKENAVVKSTPYVVIGNVVVKASEYDVKYYIDADHTIEMTKTNMPYVDNKATIYVTVSAKAKANCNYETPNENVAEGQYTVWLGASKTQDLSKAKVTFYDENGAKLTKISYTGTEVEPANVVVQFGKETPLKLGEDFTYEVINNVNKGKATVIINAVDGSGYAGGKTATFSIVAQKLAGIWGLFN